MTDGGTNEERFAFGRNWRRFLSLLNEERITESENGLKRMLRCGDLEGLTFLDVGSGSGLSSLAARRLGATVRSFDYDEESVACTRELKRRYFPDDDRWEVSRGDALDADFLRSLGTFDVVYSWGVLHHTGDMWTALENVHPSVAPGGRLFLALYNHQVYWSRYYTWLKRTYVRAPLPGKWLIGGAYAANKIARGLVKDLVLLRNPRKRYRDKVKSRGMSSFYDWIDWVGGYPFETSKPEQIFHFYRDRGFVLTALRTCGGGYGCNEYVFQRSPEALPSNNSPDQRS